MKGNLLTTIVAASFLLPGAAAFAGPADGLEDFSIDRDWSTTTNAPSDGQINYSAENGTWGDDFVIAPLGPDDQIDALSSHHRGGWDHNVGLRRVITGDFEMTFSVDNDGNIFEWHVSGDWPEPFGAGRSLGQDGHFPATPNPINWEWSHDSETELFGADHKDLDALEHHDHFSPYPYPFPGAPTDWEVDPKNVYFSTERGASDIGDVFNMSLGTTSPYLDDVFICNVLNVAGYGCEDRFFNIDALIVYDVMGDLAVFDPGSDLFNSDTIFFSVAPGSIAEDPYGDIIWWVSAYDNGIGGLYGDPHLDYNVDALDHHVPEPTTLALIGLGLAGIGLARKKKQK
jgi:hypothetical protein